MNSNLIARIYLPEDAAFRMQGILNKAHADGSAKRVQRDQTAHFLDRNASPDSGTASNLVRALN